MIRLNGKGMAGRRLNGKECVLVRQDGQVVWQRKEAVVGNPYAYYRFDGGILDSSGNGRHLLPTVVPLFAAGDGGRQALACGAYMGRTGLKTPFNYDESWGELTIVFKMYTETGVQPIDGAAVFDVSVYNYGHVPNGMIFQFFRSYLSSQNDWWFDQRYASGDYLLSSTMMRQMAGWNKVGIVVSHANKYAALFLNGAPVAGMALNNGFFVNAAEPITIGTSTYTAQNRYFTGLLQDFLVYKEALAPAAVVEIMGGL